MSTIAVKSVVRHDAARGGLVYPFLSGAWEIRSFSVSEELPESSPTLRWVKDDKVMDLHTGQSTEEFLAGAGLQLHMERGASVLSKRLSRIMRPYRYFAFFQPHEIALAQGGSEMDAGVWDGAALISRQLVSRLLNGSHSCRQRRQLEAANRVEFTLLHEGGQEKGHALVVDWLSSDMLLPPGGTKTEITLEGRVFVGLQPVRSADDMRLDVQSLVNLYPFFQPEHLLAWMQMESALFLDSIRSGKIDQLLARLGRFETEAELEAIQRWWLGEYLASGGSLMWFAGTIKAMARQHLLRLQQGQNNLRFPVPGGHYYLFPAEIGERRVEPGQVELDPASATAWVSTEDWQDYMVNVLGGCDGDDAVWVFPFRDYDGVEKVLLWRSPNQVGEYVILRPTAKSHVIQWQTVFGNASFPTMDSRDLPPRIDTVRHAYGTLERFPSLPYSPAPLLPCPSAPLPLCAAMQPAIEQARINRGALGAYCNMLMLTKALYGKLPHHLPARLEDVIDGAVKSTRDLSPVLGWVGFAAGRVVEQGKPIPASLFRRIEANLTDKQKAQLIPTTNHWLDVLQTAVSHHITTYEAEIAALSAEAAPPAAVIEHGYKWAAQGQQLRRIFQQGIAQKRPFSDIATDCTAYLAGWNDDNARWILLGSLADAIHRGGSDAAAWQQGLAPKTISALRAIGVIGEPVWTRVGALLWVEENVPTVVPLQINGIWFNWLKCQGYHFSSMASVPQALREKAKAKVSELANGRFLGQVLTTQVTDGERITTYTANGNLFGFVQRGQELVAAASHRWSIQSAIANDGNLFIIAAAA